jgi:stage III sporulation protein AA
MDVLTGCSKAEGIEILLRTMGPACIGVDEITSEADTQALLRAGWCGVNLLATAHAASIEDLHSRPVYKRLIDCGLFQSAVVLRPNKTWYTEKMNL